MRGTIRPEINVGPIMNEVLPVKRQFADDHDHESCVEQALLNAVRICRDRGLRLTAQRRRVLELVWKSHKPVGAYELLDALKLDGKKAGPPTVYRALDFLIGANLVHRLDSLNAFVGCPDPDNPHTGQFLGCRSCRSVAELDDQTISDLIASSAQATGFLAEEQTLEVQGVCAACIRNSN